VRKRWSSLAVLMFVCAAAGAQLIDLGGGSAPKVDASTATGELASFLITQADEIDASETLTDPLRASAAVRRLAAAMLTSGQSLGERGAPRLVIARTMVAHLEALDTALAGNALPSARAALLAQDCIRLASDLPGRQGELDRALRDAFAPLTNALEVAEPAWFIAVPVAPDTTSLASLAAEPPERLAALADLDLLFIRARALPSHRASADRAIDLVRAAAPVLAPPGWVDPDVRITLAGLFDIAIVELRDPVLADGALSMLTRLGAAAGFIDAVDGVEPAAVRRRARLRANPLLAAVATEPDRAERVCRAADQILRQASDAGVLALEPFLPTFARVAWRAAETEWQAANARLIDAMLEQLDATDPMTEPAMLAAIRAQREPRQLLTDISRVATYLTGVAPDLDDERPRRPGVLPDRRLLAAHVLALGKEMVEPETRDDAVRQLSAIAALVRASEPLPRERRLRDSAGADMLNAATGEQPARLFDALDELHKRAADQLQMKDPVAPDSPAAEIVARADQLVGLLEAIDAASVVTSIGRDRLDAWAAWELTERTWDELVDELPDALEAATSAVLSGGAIDPEPFAIVRLAAFYAQLLPVPAETDHAAVAALRQFALGVPRGRALGVEHREPLAAICRDLEERTSARLRGENDRVAALEARAARSSLHILEIIEARGE